MLPILRAWTKDAFKPVARHINLSDYSEQHMVVCGPSPHLGSSESSKTVEHKFAFEISILNPYGINERLSFN